MRTVKERILDMVEFDTNGGCWLWSGSTCSEYGKMKIFGASSPAHRESYRAFVGPIENGETVLHRCDVPLCVNPGHLFLGTQSDNMRDMFSKKRRVPATTFTLVTDEEREIVSERPAMPTKQLARLIGRPPITVRNIRAALTEGK